MLCWWPIALAAIDIWQEQCVWRANHVAVHRLFLQAEKGM